jgi:4-hydroxybenzoate polyprenyltransferase
MIKIKNKTARFCAGLGSALALALGALFESYGLLGYFLIVAIPMLAIVISVSARNVVKRIPDDFNID